VQDDWLKESDRKKVYDFTIKDMLDAAKHPRIVYRTTTVNRQGSEATAQGLLTIRGVEKPVEVKLKELGNNVYEGSSSVDMRQFNLKPPSAALGAIGTEAMMQLRFRLTLR
jgi:polyisoprenoid-binding protein YceI